MYHKFRINEKMDSHNRLLTIEWEMMDKTRFFGLSVVNSIALRGILYPLTVIKTRLMVGFRSLVFIMLPPIQIYPNWLINFKSVSFHYQVQKQNAVYKGTFDALGKIIRREGVCGLYKGFWVNTMQVVSGIGYLITYEKVRDLLTKYGNIRDSKIKGLIGGGCGSLVSQTIITPFDVISQHMMVIGGSTSKFGGFSNPLFLNPASVSKHGLTSAIVRELYRRDGLKGFYRGYIASVNMYVPSSALWWMFYPIYSDLLIGQVPLWTSHMVVHCAAGTLSGATVSVLTNPLDVIRANMQVIISVTTHWKVIQWLI